MCQFVVVLVVNLPQGVVFWFVLLPEPRQSNGSGVFIGVLSLPVIQDERWFGERFERMLGLDFWLGLIFLLLLLCGLSFGCRWSGSLSRLGFLLGGSVLDSLVNQDWLLDNCLPDRLVDDGLKPTGGVGVLSTPGLVKDILEAPGDLRGKEKVCKCDALAD